MKGTHRLVCVCVCVGGEERRRQRDEVTADLSEGPGDRFHAPVHRLFHWWSQH